VGAKKKENKTRRIKLRAIPHQCAQMEVVGTAGLDSVATVAMALDDGDGVRLATLTFPGSGSGRGEVGGGRAGVPRAGGRGRRRAWLRAADERSVERGSEFMGDRKRWVD
jgi:hypothetical protein